MGKVTGIRVKAVIPKPDHQHKNTRKANISMRPTREQQENAVYVLGAPVKPGWSWTCDSDIVWPVLSVEGIPGFKVLDTDALPHVCRHQIEAGD